MNNRRRVYLLLFTLLILNLDAAFCQANAQMVVDYSIYSITQIEATRAYYDALYETDKRRIEAIIGEAANQSFEGQLAVACAIKNRKEGYLGVNGYPLKRIPTAEELYTAERAYYQAYEDTCYNLIKGADMWCSDVDVCQTSWQGVPMVFITKIGDHSFYRRLFSK